MKKNLRYLTTTLAATSFLACSSSYALGIGGMKLQSALNQNLKAEIALILSEGENAADLKIGLASNARFDEAGIPWTLFLSKIKFQPVTQNGKTIIKLSSNEVLKEPFLDFLVEVRGAKSTAYREFTVLVDPPESYKPIQDAAPVVPKENTPNLPHRFISAPTHYVPKSSLTVTTDSGDYGPIRENESLWHIASKFSRQNNVSVNEMVAAIYAANPDAFMGSADAMIVGKMLKIPGISASESVAVKAKPKTVVPKEKTVSTTAIPPVSTTVKPASKIETSTIDQKLSELESQLAEMKKMIADQNAQISALKAPEPLKIPESNAAVPKITAISPPPAPVSVVVLPVKPPEVPITVIPPVIVPQVTEQPAAVPVEIVPEKLPVAPIAAIPKPVETPSASTSLSTEKLDSLPSSIPADSYYYVAGAAGLLVLSLLGWLRLRNQTRTEVVDNSVEPESISDKKTADDVENELNKIDESAFNMFNNDISSDVEHESKTEYEKLHDVATESNFEEQSLSEFNQFMDDDSDKYNSGDLLYKVDVYCAYGDYEKATFLLFDEFTKHPEAHDYALRLLKLYVLQDNQAAFAEFIFVLTKLGKKKITEFWSQVSEIAEDFYPEALFFASSQAAPDLLADVDSNDMFAKHDMFAKVESDMVVSSDIMNFGDNAISSGIDVELNVEELLDKATADFFKSPIQYDDENDDTETMKSEEKNLFDELELGASSFDLDFTTLEAGNEPIKETKIEPAFDLDFTMFEGEPESAMKKSKMDSTFDLDFSTFEVEPEPESRIKEPKIESEFDLDFTTFEVESEPRIKEPNIESKFDLDFTTFEVEPELRIKEPKIESEFDLDFTTFEVEPEPRIKEPKIESEFDLDFTTFEVEPELRIKEPKIESEFDLDFTTFEVEPEPRIKEPKIESKFDLDFTTFEVEPEPRVKEPKIESKFDLDFTIENAHFDLSELGEAENAKPTQ